MDDLGFIVASYAVTFLGVGLFASFVLRQARKRGRDVPPDERPWS